MYTNRVFRLSMSLMCTGKWCALENKRISECYTRLISQSAITFSTPTRELSVSLLRRNTPIFFLQDYEQFITIICKFITIETWKTFFWQSSEEKFFPYLISVHFNCSRNMVPLGCCHCQHLIIWQLQDLSGWNRSGSIGVGEQLLFLARPYC